MSAAEITTILLLGTTAVLIGWDVHAAFLNREEGDTISHHMRRAGSVVATLPLAWGVIGGHFWGPHHESPLPPLVLPVALAGAGTLAWGAHALLRRLLNPPTWTALVWLGVGVALGAWLWPQ